MPNGNSSTQSGGARWLIWAAVLAAVIAVIALATHRRPNKQPFKLIVWGLQPSEEAAGQRAKVVEFERREGIRVSILSMGAGQMNPQKLMTAIVGKKPPDVINQDRFTIGDWASRDTFRPLDDLIARDIRRRDPLAIRQEDYYPACWAEANYKGRVYAIPNSTDDRNLFYNRALFREAGLDPNRPPATWDELLAYAKKLTASNKDGSFKRAGFIPNYGNSWLYLYSWTNGGEFMDATGRKCTMDNPRSVEALRFMVSVYDALKGAERLDSFQSSFQPYELDPFLTGRVAMKIDVNGAMEGIARYNRDLDFGVAPAPVPRERFEAEGRFAELPKLPAGLDGLAYGIPADRMAKLRKMGKMPFLTWSGGFSYAIPKGVPQQRVEVGWRFTKWMVSPEAELIGAKAQQEYNRRRGRAFVPTMSANVRANEAVFLRFASPEPKFRNAQRFCLDMMPYSRFRPVTFVGQRLWDEHVRAFDRAIHHSMTPEQAMRAGTYVVQKELDKTFSRSRYRVISVRRASAVIALILLTLAAVVFVRARRSGPVGRLMRGEAIAGYLFAGPWILGLLIFTAGPIIFSIVFSFCDYDVLHAPRFLGIGNYRELLTDDWPLLSKTIYNAGFLAAVGIPLGIITGLAIAMLLNTKVWGMSSYRTAYYLPSIVPIVASAVLWIWVLNPEMGIVNTIWRATLSNWFGWKSPGWIAQPTEFFGLVSWVWTHTLAHIGIPLPSILSQPHAYIGAKSALITMGLWGVGGSMILWLAGLQGIPKHLYEAAEIDGAGLWGSFRHVTLPMLTPYLFFNLIMSTIGALQTFETAYIMTAGGPLDATLVPVLYLFNNAFTYFKMGYASALAWILFVVIMALTVLQLKLAPRWVHYEQG